MKTNQSITKWLALLAFLILNASGSTANAAVTFTITPASVSNIYNSTITLQIGGLTNTETVVIQKFLDLNTNGVIDGNDWLVQQFNLTDGSAGMVIAGVTNFNVPGDTDGTANGQITAALNFQNGDFVQNIVGKYLYKLSSPVGHFAPITNQFVVTNFPFPQKITGNVVSNSTSATVPNAVVILFPYRPNNPLAVVVANNAGSYSVPLPPGTYVPVAFRSNYVANYTAPVLMLTNNQTITTNLALTNATSSISGTVVDASNSSIGLPGVVVPAISASGLIAVTFTDTNGNFNVPVTAGQWVIGSSDSGLIIHGYVGDDKSDINANAGATNVTLTVPKATALIYGSVKDNFGNPIVGLEMESSDNNYIYDSVSVTDTNGNYVVGVQGSLAGVTWNIEPADDDFDSDYQWLLYPQGPWSAINSNTVWQVNFTAIPATNTISGTLKDNYGNPISGVEMLAQSTISGLYYRLWMAYTDSGGKYSINVANGSWTVGIDHVGGSDGLPSNYLVPADQYPVIANNNAVINFTATNTLSVVLSAPQISVGKTNFTFQLSGPAGTNYVLEASTNLVNWSSISTSSIPISGSITLSNAINGYNRRFYRFHLQ